MPAAVEMRDAPKIMLKASLLDGLLFIPPSAMYKSKLPYNFVLFSSFMFLRMVSSSCSFIKGISAACFLYRPPRE